MHLMNESEPIQQVELATELQTVGFILVMLFCFSLIVNSMILIVFVHGKDVRKPSNFFAVILSGYNIFQTVFYLPMIIAGTYNKKIPFGKTGCVVQAFIFYFNGAFSIYNLMIISIERYWAVVKPQQTKPLTFKLCFKVLAISVAFCLLWSSFPLMGWSHYEVETNSLYCSMEYNEKSYDVITFNYASIFVFFLLPLGVILYTNIKIYFILQKKAQELEELNLNEETLKKLKMKKRKQLAIVIFLISGYLVSWTPYCSLMAYGAFGDVSNLNFVLTLVPVLCSKSTLIWCPVLEMIFNNSVRQNILVLQDPNTVMLVDQIDDTEMRNSSKKKKSKKGYEFESDSRYRYFDRNVRGWKAARSDVYDFMASPGGHGDRMF